MAEKEKGPFAGLTITKDMTFEEILEVARKEYGYIDTIFQTVPELKKLLTKAVKNKYQAKQFQQEFTRQLDQIIHRNFIEYQRLLISV
jgi:predicted HAD superfamily Cof-like phosphohydrolase